MSIRLDHGVGMDLCSAQDIVEPPKRLQSITIMSSVVVDSVAFTDINQAGHRHTAGLWANFMDFYTVLMIETRLENDICK